MRVLLIGRFQPFHNGHLRLVEAVSSGNGKIKIIIGSIQESFTYKNPFTYNERKEMIRNSLNSIGLKNFIINGVPDKNSDYAWLREVKKAAGNFDICYAGNRRVIAVFKKYHESARLKKLFRKAVLSGKLIRNSISENKRVDMFLPSGTVKVIRKVDGLERIKNIRKTGNKRIFTIGHSKRKIREFSMLLKDYGIQTLVDVRRFPGSKHNPQFGSARLKNRLKKDKIKYVQFGELGGLRKPDEESKNKFWKNRSFRGYADYMNKIEFKNGIKKLVNESKNGRTVIMCSEILPWKCHRFLISDFLVQKGFSVTHIINKNSTREHKLNRHATFSGNYIAYR